MASSSQVTIKPETEILPPLIDFITGKVIQPARAGKQTIHILDSDDEGFGHHSIVCVPKEIKQEDSPRPSPEIKCEYDESLSSVMSFSRGRDPRPKSRQRHKISRPRPPSRRGESRRRSTALHSSKDPYNFPSDNSSDGDDSSSDEGHTPPATPSSTSSSERSGSESSSGDFRPSRSPSRFPGTPCRTTRSQSRGRQYDEDRARSVPNPVPFHIPIHSLAKQSGEASSNCMPGSSRDHQHGQDVSHNASSLGSGHERDRGSASRRARAATAGPSYGHHASRHTSRTRNRSPKGKGRAIDEDSLVNLPDSMLFQNHNEARVKEERKAKKQKRKEEKRRKEERRRRRAPVDDEYQAKDKGKVRVEESDHDEGYNRRPPRLARLETSIESTPSPGLLTPEPSSSWEKVPCHPTHSPGLFVSSPAQPESPDPSLSSVIRATRQKARGMFHRSSPPQCSTSGLSSSSPLISKDDSLAMIHSPSRSSPKRRYVNFVGLDDDSDDATGPDKFDGMFKDGLAIRFKNYEDRLEDHDRKRVRLEEEYNKSVAFVKDELEKQNMRMTDIFNVVESLTKQIQEANLIGRRDQPEVESAGPPSQQNRPTTSRPLVEGGIRLEQRPPRPLELGRRNGVMSPRPAQPAESLGGRRQQLASQDRSRPRAPCQRARNGISVGSSSVSAHNNIRRGAAMASGSRPHHERPRNDMQSNERPRVSEPVPRRLSHSSRPSGSGQQRFAPSAPPPAPANDSPLMQFDIKHQALNYPVLKTVFSLDYDEEVDSETTTGATDILLRTHYTKLHKRLLHFCKRPGFFNTGHRDNATKGCWTVTDEKSYREISINANRKSTVYTISRLAIRLWHNEESVLKLFADKTYQARSRCHNKSCLNPRHLVVETSKEFHERAKCFKEGECSGHSMKLKTDPTRKRAPCILSPRPPQ